MSVCVCLCVYVCVHVQKHEEQRHKAAKDEPLGNRVQRAFDRVMGNLYQVQNGEAAVKQLRSSTQIRNVSPCVHSDALFRTVAIVLVTIACCYCLF